MTTHLLSHGEDGILIVAFCGVYYDRRKESDLVIEQNNVLANVTCLECLRKALKEYELYCTTPQSKKVTLCV